MNRLLAFLIWLLGVITFARRHKPMSVDVPASMKVSIRNSNEGAL